jgi:hypothetical protein
MMMKKFLISALAASTMVVATPALADNALQYNLTATVGAVCGVYAASPTIAVSFGDLAAVPTTTVVSPGATSASYRCNSPNGFTRAISSANNGKLVRGGSNGDVNNSIAFRMVHGGGSGLAFTATQLTAPLATNLGASPAFAAGQTGSVRFELNGVADNTTNNNSALGTTVFAGTYTDTVTIAVTAN